jgi:hypothetical protein
MDTDKITISLRVTKTSDRMLGPLGKSLVPGVVLNRGDVLDFLVAEKAKELGLDRGSLVEVLGGDGQVETVEECNG